MCAVCTFSFVCMEKFNWNLFAHYIPGQLAYLADDKLMKAKIIWKYFISRDAKHLPVFSFFV